MTSWIGSLPSELEAGYAHCSTSPCSGDRGRGCRIGGFQRRLRPRAEACVERRGGREAAMACDKYARAKGWKMNIAVLDDGGGLLYFRRDPASFRGSVE